ISLELRNRLPIYPSRSLVGLHTLEGFPDFPFGDQKRPCLVHGLLQLPDGRSWPVVSAEQRNPFAPPPLHRGFTTTMGCSAPALRFGTLALAVGAACGFFLGIGEQAFSRSVRVPG